MYNSFLNLYERDLYSPKYSTYDKWGMSAPSHVYGPLKHDEMVKEFDQTHNFAPSTTLDKNYELIPPNKDKKEFYDSDSVSERMKKYIIIVILFIVLLYLLDKSCSNQIRNLSSWTKATIMLILIFSIIFFIFY
jgi:hypothetical protein